MIDIEKEQHPETLDPFADCCATFPRPGGLGGGLLRLRGVKAPNVAEANELCRQAIAAHLDSLGVWEMRKIRLEQEPLRLMIEELISKAGKLSRNSSIETAGRKLLAVLDAGKVHPDAAGMTNELRALMTELDTLTQEAQAFLAGGEPETPPEDVKRGATESAATI
jgi:hypothetical protein